MPILRSSRSRRRCWSGARVAKPSTLAPLTASARAKRYLMMAFTQIFHDSWSSDAVTSGSCTVSTITVPQSTHSDDASCKHPGQAADDGGRRPTSSSVGLSSASTDGPLSTTEGAAVRMPLPSPTGEGAGAGTPPATAGSGSAAARSPLVRASWDADARACGLHTALLALLLAGNLREHIGVDVPLVG
jgi:hypothetical protein